MTKHDETKRAAQEGDLPPLLTDERIERIAKTIPLEGCDRQTMGWGIGYSKESGFYEPNVPKVAFLFARAIESEVRLALAAAGGGVPQGWKLVPMEPTDAMLREARGAYLRCTQSLTGFLLADTRAYQAALAAAPEAPAKSIAAAGVVLHGCNCRWDGCNCRWDGCNCRWDGCNCRWDGCNCRWDGDEQIQTCELHQAHIEAIHEWAERAKAAERKLAAAPEAPAQGEAQPEKQPRGLLSSRLLCDIDCQPWVIDEVVRLEAALRAALEQPEAQPAQAEAPAFTIDDADLNDLLNAAHWMHQPGANMDNGMEFLDALERVKKRLATQPPASQGERVTVESIRAAGGIVHSDGNIFFTNIDQLCAALSQHKEQGS